MLKQILATAAVVAFLGAAACSQGPNEEAGENADTATEEATSGATDPGQGPMEEAGEHMDETTPNTALPSDTTTTTVPPTTP